jgi:hypothetical protein
MTRRFTWTKAAYGILTTGVVVTGLLWFDRANPFIVPADIFHAYAGVLERVLAGQTTEATPAARTNYVQVWAADTNTFIRYGTNGLAITNTYVKPAGITTQLYTNQYAGIATRIAMPYTAEGFISGSTTSRWIFSGWSNLTFTGFAEANANGKYNYYESYDMELDYWGYNAFSRVGKAVSGIMHEYTNANGYTLFDYGPWGSCTSITPFSAVILLGSTLKYKTFCGDSPAYGPWFAAATSSRAAASTLTVSIVRADLTPGLTIDSPCYAYCNRALDSMSDYEGLMAMGPFVHEATITAITNSLRRLTAGTNSLYMAADATYSGKTNHAAFVNLCTNISWAKITNSLGYTNAFDVGTFPNTNLLLQVHEIARQLKKSRCGSESTPGAYSGRQWVVVPSNALWGFGTSTNSWAEAKANAESSAVVTNYTGNGGFQYTVGNLSGGVTWEANFYSCGQYLRWPGCNTQIQHTIEFMVRTELNTNLWTGYNVTFDANGTPAVNNQFASWTVHTNTYTNNGVWVGSTNIGTWCAEPTNPANPTIRGWQARGDGAWTGEDTDANSEIMADWNFQYCTNDL